MKRLIIIVVLLFNIYPVFSQELNSKEKELYQLILEYRKKNNLAAIPISKSLSIVAQTHVKDLQINNPVSASCNLHSWSTKGKWKSVCYSGDKKSAELMWSKPRELTTYKADAYEIAYYSSSSVEILNALKTWKESKGHNDVMLNLGMWSRNNWNAIGIAVSENYAVVWFGVDAE